MQSFGKCIEWKPIEDSVVSENQDQDPEWSLVDTHIRRTRTSSEGPDSLGRTRIVRILFSDLNSFRVNHGGQQLIFMQKDGTTYVAFFQLSNAESFVNSLKGFIKFVKSRTNRNLYIVVDEVQSVLSKSFAELDLFQENTSDYVWKFVKNLHNRPYETTLEAFSKLADICCKYTNELWDRRNIISTISTIFKQFCITSKLQYTKTLLNVQSKKQLQIY